MVGLVPLGVVGAAVFEEYAPDEGAGPADAEETGGAGSPASCGVGVAADILLLDSQTASI